MLVLLLACAQPKDDDDDPEDDGTPRISIDAPAEDASVDSCFTVEVDVRNFEIVDPRDEVELVDGHGHWHVVLPARFFDCESASCEVAMTDAEAGDIEITARLVDNLHVAVGPDGLATESADGPFVEDTRTLGYSGTECPVE